MIRFKTTQFLRFCVMGVFGTLVDLLILYAGAPFFGWYGARVLSFFVAATSTWGLNRRYTFASDVNSAGRPDERSASAGWREYLRYLLSMLLGGSVNYTVYAIVLSWVPLPGAPLLGVALGSGAGLFFNYLIARHFVFRAGE